MKENEQSVKEMYDTGEALNMNFDKAQEEQCMVSAYMSIQSE